MRWTDVITLISVTYVRDSLNQEVPQETKRTIRANPWSVDYREQASDGLDSHRWLYRYEVQTVMYRDETRAEMGGKRYEVSADKRGSRTILTLTEVRHGNNQT